MLRIIYTSCLIIYIISSVYLEHFKLKTQLLKREHKIMAQKQPKQIWKITAKKMGLNIYSKK
jgi:hypothetical protein